METRSKDVIGYLVLVVATMAGSSSLLLFGFFLFGYSFTIIELGYGQIGIHSWDAMLCLLFFVQHSAMIRKRFRQRLTAIVPHYYQGALYTVASSAALVILVIFWQSSNRTLLDLQGQIRWATHGIFLASLIGIVWSMRALRAFDMFGVQPILSHVRGSRIRTMPFSVRGPYKWVRHPSYFFILVLIWCSPNVTTDRFLFNLLFTTWIVLGTFLEERDLVAEFGDSYLNYQGKVPMLIPWKIHRPFSI